MSYRKVSEGVKTIEHTGSMIVLGNQIDNQGGLRSIMSEAQSSIHTYEMPMSYIACPVCDNQHIQSCNCYPQNFACPGCSWKHITHDHQSKKPPVIPDYGGNVNNNSLLGKIIRK